MTPAQIRKRNKPIVELKKAEVELYQSKIKLLKLEIQILRAEPFKQKRLLKLCDEILDAALIQL